MKEETVLSLKWQSFPSHLAVSLDTCYEKQQFVDLSLVCKDGTILKCHKMVLANSSTFFRRLLMANDHPHPMIILHDIEADDLKTIVNFMYCGEIQVVQSEVRRLLKLAEILEVTGLRHIQTSVMAGESNHATTSETSRKTSSRLKLEETRSLPGRANTESHAEIARPQIKATAQARFAAHPSAHSHKNIPKAVPQDNIAIRKNEEISINALNQRLETGNSGISIVDINDLPSTSKGLPQSCQKRKEPVDPVISWPTILSAISKDKALPLKKLCIMDEVEITAGKSCTVPLQDSKQNEPLDRRKVKNSSSFDHGMKYAVYIKDEVDIDVEEDVDMDPLEIDEIDNDNSETSKAPTQMFHYNRRTASYFPYKMNMKMNKVSCDKVERVNDIIDNLNPDKNVTEEEFQNFMHRVTEVESIVKKLASHNPEEQECGKILADGILQNNIQKEISEDAEVRIKANRSVINKYSTKEDNSNDPNKVSREIFMKSVEDDAKKRAEDRKARNERAETLKRIANGAFKEGDYEKAITYYSKALEQRKDSSVIWNNRALSYMHLGLLEKALHDCEWALKVNDSNLKALLNSAKCHMHLGNREKSREYIQTAKERNPHFNKFIEEFEENLAQDLL